MRPIASDSELKHLHRLEEGFIYNDFVEPRGAAALQYNLLHWASCRWIKKMNTNVDKYYAESQVVAVAWLEQNRGQEGVRWRWCGSRRRSSPPATKTVTLTSTTSRTVQRSGPFVEREVERLFIQWSLEHGFRGQTQVKVASGIIALVVNRSIPKIATAASAAPP